MYTRSWITSAQSEKVNDSESQDNRKDNGQVSGSERQEGVGVGSR